MGSAGAVGLTIDAMDVSQQKMRRVSNIGVEITVRELTDSLLAAMNLPQNDSDGRPVAYQAVLEREGRHLQSWEKVGDAVKSGDRVVLQPNIDAG
jgi:hypothetical protein